MTVMMRQSAALLRQRETSTRGMLRVFIQVQDVHRFAHIKFDWDYSDVVLYIYYGVG